MRTIRRGQPKHKSDRDQVPDILSDRERVREILRAALPDWVERNRHAYERSKNPVFVWHVYLLCSRQGLWLPPWVREYFDGVAQTFDAWARGKTPMPEPRTLPVAIAKTLEMRRLGARTVFREYLHDWTDTELALAQRVHSQVMDGHKVSQAWEGVAKECGVSASTVRRAWGKHKHRFKLDPPRQERLRTRSS